MRDFIKLTERSADGNNASTVYLNLDSIIGIHKERGTVYVANSTGQDIFVISDESMNQLLSVVEREALVYGI
jgi:hypothetical protein